MTSMADWLAYRLEGVYADQPEMGVIRKHKTGSGLIKYQPKGNPAIGRRRQRHSRHQKAEAIVVMLGLDDRVAIREPEPKNRTPSRGRRRTPRPSPMASLRRKSRGEAGWRSQGGGFRTGARRCCRQQWCAAGRRPGEDAGSPSGLREFREKRWEELYREKIDEMIGVLKAKGVPVLWVGLPAVRGIKATSDAAFLDTLYREAAGRAGITYVDVWDGFVDEAGRFFSKAPISKDRSENCAPPMACTSPGPARSSSRIMSSANSTGCWLRVPRRSCCRPSRQSPTPMHGRISRRRVRWPGRSFPWWPLRSARINCSALPGRDR